MQIFFFLLIIIFLYFNYNKHSIKNIYYINLENSVDRLKLMKKKLKKINLKATRYQAINGIQYIPTDEDKIIFSDYFKKKTDQRPGVFGCLKSHLNLIIHAYQKKMDYIIILEDDINFDDKFNEYFKHLSWGKNVSKYKKIANVLDRNLYFCNDQKWNSQGAIGYILSKKGIKNIINIYKKGISPKLHASDWLLIRGLTQKYFIYPPIVEHDNNFDSDILNM